MYFKEKPWVQEDQQRDECIVETKKRKKALVLLIGRTATTIVMQP